MYRGSAGRSSTLRCKTRQKLTTSGLQNSSRSRCHPPSGSRAVFEPWTRIFDRENVPLRHTCRCRVSRRVRQLAPEDFFHPTAPDYRFGTTGRRAASFHACNLPEFLRSFRGGRSLIREKSRLAVYRRRLKSDITLAYEKTSTFPEFRKCRNVQPAVHQRSDRRVARPCQHCFGWCSVLLNTSHFDRTSMFPKFRKHGSVYPPIYSELTADAIFTNRDSAARTPRTSFGCFSLYRLRLPSVS